ncbi:MAG: STAS domain-containing protein [Pseudomonadota bacterium]
MDLHAVTQGGMLVVRAPGSRLEAAIVPMFKRKMIELLDNNSSDVVVDMSDVEFIDSSGLGALVGVLRHDAGRRRFELTNVAPAVLRVFQLTRLDRVFSIRQGAPAHHDP